MCKTDFKNLLTIKPASKPKYKNKIIVWKQWDGNDMDYVEETTEPCDITPEMLFSNKKLILCLAYIMCPYNFKGHTYDDCWGEAGGKFDTNIGNNHDIDGLEDILNSNNFAVYCDWGLCHTLVDMEITYYDENGTKFDITFDDIHKRWENMTYEEICAEINNA